MTDNIIQLASRRPKLEPAESELCWKCLHCGCTHWYINGDLTMQCVGCDRWQPLMVLFDNPPPAA